MAETIFELAMNLVETLISVDFITRYLGCKYSDYRKTVVFTVMCVLSFAEVTIINKIVAFEGIGTFIFVISYFMLYFFWRGA